MNIQQLFGGFLGLLLLAGAPAQAQNKLPPRRAGAATPLPRLSTNGEGVKDGLTMQKGRVVLTELGITTPLTADKKLINGTVITTAGLVTTPDGTATQMAEGDQVSLTGRVTPHAAIAEADSLAKIKLFDAKHPGKRKKMDELRERHDKALAKTKEKQEKAKEKSKKKH